MAHSVLVVMDPIDSVKTQKDTSFALMLEAQRRNWTLYYCQPQDLYLAEGKVKALCQRVKVQDNPNDWYSFQDASQIIVDCGDFSAILMRKDPPFNMNYIYSTYLLELAQQQGALVVNDPASLRDCNEKLYTAWFPEHTPKTLVSANAEQLKQFAHEHGDVIFKPLDGMGGASIFRVKSGDPNLSVIIETLTAHGQDLAMAQQFIPQITEGDKRILIVNGEVVPYTLARIPSKGETRGNLAAGGSGVPMPITADERAIAEAIAPDLVKRGLLFVGLDVIGQYVTEINVTSPTCMRELENEYKINIGAILFAALEKQLSA
ncbi:glutathione synthase [Kangiella spongicola]|uniref:Glutathione synthetase n=1 Tax=Kangiella spongicola TaxID=796379 RepID=A0A318D6L5_9GAMM|nr:glutathione synthase [Kangiella spongicola]PXF64453.1 glutathione synthase [Kangiella spongicola]